MIMDLTEKNIDIISTSSEEYIQNQITNNDADISPKRQRVNGWKRNMMENKDIFPILISNH